MKKFLITCIALSISALTFAQNDPGAKKLLTAVSKKYNSYKTIRSDFGLTVVDANKKSINNSGTMFFNKPKQQYAIKMKDQEILSDGKTVWNVSKEIKEVQVTEAENNTTGTIGPNNLFTFYQSGYKYIGMDDERITKNGKSESVKVVELSPLDQKTNYFKIKLRINKNNHIHDVTIFDKSSNQFTYTIQNLYVGEQLANNLFSFQKNSYPGYEIVDLR